MESKAPLAEVPELLEEVRRGCRYVADQSAFVRIDLERIPGYIAGLSPDMDREAEHEPACHFLGQGESTAAFFLTLDAINFGSGYFPLLRKRTGLSGYFTVASSLRDEYDRNGPLSAASLAEITTDQCLRLFQQDPGQAVVRELMQLFAEALNDLGRCLLQDFAGRFSGLIESAGSSAERLVRQLLAMRYFRDAETYRGMRVPFLKRAQLTAADLALAFHGKGLGRFHDLDRLTIFADNLVPHVLRLDGILRYEESLARRIDDGELIQAGSEEEIEIRACALHAVEQMVEAFGRRGRIVTAVQLDYLLWNRGQQAGYKRAKPRHRTRTVFY